MSSLLTTLPGVEIVTVAEASEEHPRHGGADMIELEDGSIFMSKMLIHKSGLELGAGDDAPSDLVTLVSRDGGRTWGDQKAFLQPGPDETAAPSSHTRAPIWAASASRGTTTTTDSRISSVPEISNCIETWAGFRFRTRPRTCLPPPCPNPTPRPGGILTGTASLIST